jgi:hypothetical protein
MTCRCDFSVSSRLFQWFSEGGGGSLF